ncbi:MAG: hypothetical protein K8R69_03735 [Deltaproteobacteria bacterium]|nr:hypothetical protein [Deltaproteobacteria bacterium]
MALGMIITAVSLIFTFGILGVVFYFVYAKIIKPGQNAKRILQTGEPGKARILALNDTGVKINDNPQVRLTLEVTPDRSRRPYQVDVKQVISMLQIPQFQPGARLFVRIDQADPNQVAVAGFDTSPVS